jgi:hypothetical protein
MDSSEMLLDQLRRDPQGQVEVMEQLAPLIQSIVDGYVDDLEERFMAQGQSWLQVIANVYAINDLLIEREIFTAEELRSAVTDAANKVTEAIKQQADIAEEEGTNLEV